MTQQIAILIPCYNEEMTIEKVVKDFKIAVPTAKIYVYDNNSTDKTAEIAKKAGAIVKFEKNKGKGNVIKKMFEDIEADCYIMVDGDDTYPAEDAKKMADLVLNGNIDMVVGDRLSSTYFTENKRMFHNFGNKFVRFIVNKLFKSNLRDILTGYRAFSYSFAKTFPIVSKNFEIETEMTIYSIFANMSTENIIINYKDRPKGSTSKLNTFSDGLKVIRTVLNLFRNYKPLKFFLCIATILIILDLSIFVPLILIPFNNTGLVERLPTLIMCGFIAMASLLAIFSGMILDSIMQKEKREIKFKIATAKMQQHLENHKKTQ